MTDAASGRAILGVSADFHDSSAAVLVEGHIVAAAEEERFSRRKHEAGMPDSAMAYCLAEMRAVGAELEQVVFFEKPFTAWERLVVTHARVGPRGLPALSQAVPNWLRSKLWVRQRLARSLRHLGFKATPIAFAEHHQSHAASAFFPSPFERAAILTFDGVGEWATSSIGRGRGGQIEMLAELQFPHSIGLLYSAVTAHCGFAVNDGEYKLMGLAPYGEPTFVQAIRQIIAVGADGSVRLDPRAVTFESRRRMLHPRTWSSLGGPPNPLGAEPTQREADLACSMQQVLEDIVVRIARHAHELTGESRACLAGGVALNCVANAVLLRDGPFDDVWIQPAAGDSGGALGAAYWGWHQLAGHPRHPGDGDGMQGASLGPAYPADDIAAWLADAQVPFRRIGPGELAPWVAVELSAGRLVGWFQGRMEFGPRALGHRSILADPRDAAVIGRLNSAVKGREGFRPFAPAVLAAAADEWFYLPGRSDYMLLTAQVRSYAAGRPDPDLDFPSRLAMLRSALPACTHVNGSARVQTVSAAVHPRFHELLEAFGAITGCPVLLNTSFNRSDEPIVCTPADALRCFEVAGLDVLVLEDCVVERAAVAALAS